MAIDEVYKINSLKEDETSTLKKALSSIAEQAVGTQFTDSAPSKVPVGKLVVYDDGAGTVGVSVKTGEGNIVALTPAVAEANPITISSSVASGTAIDGAIWIQYV